MRRDLAVKVRLAASEMARLDEMRAPTSAAVNLERALRDAIDRRVEVPMLTVQRTVSSGEIVALAKTKRSHRQVPLSDRALEAIEAVPRRLDVPFVFPAKRGGVLDLNHFRQREWTPAIEATGIARPARGCTTRARRSPPMRSMPASRFSNWLA
jgi:integrase